MIIPDAQNSGAVVMMMTATNDDDLRIPSFLIMPAAERQAAWASAPPPTTVQITPRVRTVPADLPPDLADFEAKKKKLKQQKRIGALLSSQARKDIPPAFLSWDSMRGKWVDLRIDQRKRLAAAYARLGLKPPEENDMALKINIVPYMQGSDLPNPRGRTSISENAEPFEIAGKVAATARRVGVKKLDRIEIVKPDGAVSDTWKPDESQENMVSADGQQIVSLVAEDKEEEPVAKATKKTTKPKKTASKNNGSSERKPGVIATIAERINLAKGSSIEEMLDHLEKVFPDRKRESMRGTCKIQAPKHAKRTEDDEKRGRVYYGTK